MNPAVLLRRAFGRLAALRLDVEVDRLVVRALRSAAPGPGPGLLQAARDAGVEPGDALERAVTAYLAFSVFNLSDDLSDGECHDLPPAEAQAVLLILHSLFFSGLRDLRLAPEVEAAVLADLVAAEEAQVLEVGTTTWDAARLRTVTGGIAGRQWAAYLRIMWAGTTLEPRAPDLAAHIGRLALLAGDIRSDDPRYFGLPGPDRHAVLAEALASARALEETGLGLARGVVVECRPTIIEELRATAGASR